MQRSWEEAFSGRFDSLGASVDLTATERLRARQLANRSRFQSAPSVWL